MSASPMVLITVNNLNPIGNTDTGAGFTTTEDSSVNTGSVLVNDNDPNPVDVLSVSGLNVSGTVGSVTNNGDGTFHYDPNGQFDFLAAGQQVNDTFSYTVSDDDGGSGSALVTITVIGQNDAPTNIVLDDSSVIENSPGAVVGNLSTIDIDAGDTHTYFVGDPRFEVLNGQLKLKPMELIDFEIETAINVTITSIDSQGAPFSQTAVLNITAINDNAPSVAPVQAFAVFGDVSDGAFIGTLTATDADAGTTFSDWKIIGGNTDAIFAIDSNTGVLSVNDSTKLDFESTSSHALSIVVSDGIQNSAPGAIQVTVNVDIVSPVPAAAERYLSAVSEDPGQDVDESTIEEITENVPLAAVSTNATHQSGHQHAVITATPQQPVDDVFVVASAAPQEGNSQEPRFQTDLMVDIARSVKATTATMNGLPTRREHGSQSDPAGPASADEFNHASQHLVNSFAATGQTSIGVDEMQRDIHAQLNFDDTVIGSVTTVGSDLAVGYAVWAVRGGMLLSGLLAQMPVWTMLAPLHIVDRESSAVNEGDSLEDIVDQQQETAEHSSLGAPA
jgi:VCBS repeat-containing protein